LAYTGFPLKFPDEWWSRWMIASVGGFDNRTLIHHFSGLLMIGVSIYHIVYHLILEKPRFDILFNLKDIKDFWQQIIYSLKYTNKHPNFGRYTWKQKFEYFGAGFGAIIMGFTGILMWQPFEAMKYLPIGFIQITNLFHTWEAILASIAIFVGHFYDEHFGKFPNISWLTGNISEEEMKHEHPKEYEDIINYRKTNGDISIDSSEQDQVNTHHIYSTQDKLHNTTVNKVIGMLSKAVFTIIFMVICIWMLWISYMTLMEAINIYIL
jgi:cytochrome b subunit of formate dehydrogenase